MSVGGNEMQIGKLDHVNVRTAQLEPMIAWYSEVLGLRRGDRPDFPFAGAWMYAGDSALVHLVDSAGIVGKGSEVELKLEHFAFSAAGRSAFEAKLTARGDHFECSEIPAINIVQFNVWDPDGNHIHIDFPLDE